LFRNTSWAAPVTIGMLGESRRLSLTPWGLSTKAAFGGESEGGGGMPELEVTHSGGSPWSFVAVQPAGSAGGVTPSKSSLNVVAGSSQEAVPASSTSVFGVDTASTAPPAASSVLPIAVPATRLRAPFRLGPPAQLSVTGSKTAVVCVGPDGVSPPKLQSLPLAAALPAVFVGLGMPALAVHVFAAML
jgi:hypothetical protein